MRVVILLVVVVLVAGTLTAHAERQKHVAEYVVFGDYVDPPPATIEELTNKADVIVEGTVVRFRPYDLHEVVEGREETRMFTAVAIEDVTWIKPATGLPGPQVEILLYAAERDRGDRIVRQRLSRELAPEVGQRYLLFLKATLIESRSREEGPYWFYRERDGAFLIRDGIIIPAGDSELSKKLAGMSHTDLVSQLRAAATAPSVTRP